MTTTVINIKSLRGAFPRDENDVYIGRNMIWTSINYLKVSGIILYNREGWNKGRSVIKILSVSSDTEALDG